MNETETAVKLENHDLQIRSLKHRMDEQEEQTKLLNSIALSVEKLAMNMEQMLKEQEKQGERLNKLEDAPAEQYRDIKSTMLNTIVGAVAAAFAGGLLLVTAQYIMK